MYSWEWQNKILIEKLKEGAIQWNEWRETNGVSLTRLYLPDYTDLAGVKLAGANLKFVTMPYVNLSNADLRGCDFTKSDLSGANLSLANISGATLHATSLRGANLSGTNLQGSNLEKASLVGATLLTYNQFIQDIEFAGNMTETKKRYEEEGKNVEIQSIDSQGEILFYVHDKIPTNISDANLDYADLRSANLLGTNVNNISINGTLFGNTTIDCDLSKIENLNDIRHQGPSKISNFALYSLALPIPELFLKGLGLTPEEIQSALKIIGKSKYQSCFISHSSRDIDIAEKLYSYLKNQGVSCWLAQEDLKIGEKFRQSIDDSIKKHDKLLVILSKDSIESPWVEDEMESASEREHLEKQIVLFPIKIDDSITQCTKAWAASLRRNRHIGDFSNWTDTEEFHKAFYKLLKSLTVD